MIILRQKEFGNTNTEKSEKNESSDKNNRKKNIAAAAIGTGITLGAIKDYVNHDDDPKFTDRYGNTTWYTNDARGFVSHRADQFKDRLGRTKDSIISDWYDSDDGVATKADKIYRKVLKNRKPTDDKEYEERIHRYMREDAFNKAERRIKAGRIAKVAIPTVAIIGGGIALHKHNKKKKEEQEKKNNNNK